MATSGNFLTSDSGQGGGNYYSRMIFEWWQTASGISGSVGYHNISYHLKSYGGSTSYWQYFYQGSMNVDGSGYSWASPTKVYGGGATVFGDYSKTMYTDSNGNRSFGASAQGGIYYNTINTSGSGSWALDNIPLHAVLTALSMDSGGIPATDEGPMWLEYSNPAGTTVYSFVESPAGSTRIWTDTGGSRHNFSFTTAAMNAIQASTPNSNTVTIRIGIYDNLGGTHYDYRDRTLTIKNDTGQANPTFSTFTYADTNSTTTAITGNNQVLIQGKSTLDVTVSTANKATPNKFATMSSYAYTIGSYSQSATYSSSADVVKSIGTVSDVTGAQNLSVRAIDSRGNSKTVTQSVTILPYSSPYFVPSLAVKYTNDYDNSGGLTVSVASGSTIASISPMTLSGTDKNSVNGTSGIQFDVSKTNNTSYTGTWVNVASSRASGASDITSTLSTIASSILTKMNGIGADNTTKWYIKFKITDTLETQYYETSIDIGKPIMRIGADGNVYFNEVAYQSYNSITSSSSPAPVGSASLNLFFITALAAAATFSAPSGTPTNGNRIIFRISDNGTARALTWNSIYRSGTIATPSTTVVNKDMYVGFVYNSTDSKWDCVLNTGGY